MKIIITESQYNRILNKKKINESWYDDILDIIKTTGVGDKVKDVFKDITGIDFDDKDDISDEDIPTPKDIERNVEKIKTTYLPGVDDKEEPKKVEKETEEIPENIVIGDSQSPYIAKQSKLAELISKKGGEDALWEGGKNLRWLTQAVREYPKNKNVKNVIISIGTNGQFGKIFNDDIRSLVESLKKTFPNAELYAVKGSWGWGGNKNVQEKDVEKYYDKFSELGVRIIPTAIGKVEPHGDIPVYKKIGREIDSRINNF